MQVVSPLFQLIPISVSIIILTIALYWRIHHYTSLDQTPNITPITPSNIRPFGRSQSVIQAGLYIHQFQTFEMISNDFIFNGMVWFEFDHDAISLDTLGKFTFEKGEIIKKSEPESQILDDKLLVRYNVSVRFSSSLNYQDFPFDNHELFIYLTLPAITPSEVIFESSLNELQISPEVHTHGWQLIDKNVIIGYNSAELESTDKERTINYPGIIFSLTYRRFGIRFVLMISLPIMFVFYLALFSFSIDQMSTSLSIAVGSISTILAYRFVIEKLSPETGYFLISDYLFLIFLFGTFVVFILNILQNFILSGTTLAQKKLIIILINALITCLALYALIIRQHMSLYFLKQILRFGKKWKFNSLHDMEKFANKKPEYPRLDNTDLQHPDYTTFYRGFLPNPLQSLIASLLHTSIDTTPGDLFVLLDKLATQGEQANITEDSIALISLTEPASFFVWSDLHGSFHSLYHSIAWLNTHDYLNADLTLKRDDIYLIFNGDCVDRGAYNLETLYTVLTLMDKNPGHVIYIKGLHEHAGYWQSYSLKQELKIRAQGLSPEFIPFNTLLLRFFKTLPSTLYINFVSEPTDLFRISSSHTFACNEMNTGTFFTHPKPGISYFNMQNSQPTPTSVRVKAMIKPDNWMHEGRAAYGMGMIEQERGATAWTILSARTNIMQKEYGFHFDAFALLEIKKPLISSTISLINRNMQTKEPFIKQDSFNIITGSQTEPLIKSEIRLGSSMGFKGSLLGQVGQSIRAGISASVNTINRSGGIDGHHITTTLYNDDYTSYIARENINRLITEDHTNLIVLPVGGPTLDAYLELVRTQKAYVFFPVTGAQLFRDASLSSLINLRASNVNEAYALITYLCDSYDVTRFAFFYQDDIYEPIEQAHEILKQRNINTWIDVPHVRGSTDFKEQVNKIKMEQPDAICFFTSAYATQELFRQIGIENLINKKLCAISLTGEDSLRTYIKQHGLEMLFSSVVPDPATSTLEIVKEYRATMDASFYSYDTFSLEGYIGINLFIEILKQLKNPPFSGERIMKQLESFKEYNFKGLTLTFDPEYRNLSPSVWLETDPIWKEFSWNELRTHARY